MLIIPDYPIQRKTLSSLTELTLKSNDMCILKKSTVELSNTMMHFQNLFGISLFKIRVLSLNCSSWIATNFTANIS